MTGPVEGGFGPMDPNGGPKQWSGGDWQTLSSAPLAMMGSELARSRKSGVTTTSYSNDVLIIPKEAEGNWLCIVPSTCTTKLSGKTTWAGIPLISYPAA